MASVSLQDVFNRVYTYLRASGIDMTVDSYRTLLHLIEDAVGPGGDEGHEDALLEAAMERMPLYFDLPVRTAPNAAPPLSRGSIGYGREV